MKLAHGRAYFASGLRVALCAAIFLTAVVNASAAVLYDGALGTKPGSQGWLYLTTPPGGASAVETFSGSATSLDTTAVKADKAGYFAQFHPLLPTLDRALGYKVTFDVRVTADNHTPSDNNADAVDDRAGLSLIALSSDKRGVELGFWAGRVWAQADSPLFTQAEGAAFNTADALHQYELTVLGSAYALKVDGAPLLSGPLRNYAAGGSPYTTANFLFVGDDTSSASGVFEFSYLAITPVAEPSSSLLLALGAMSCFLARRRNKR